MPPIPKAPSILTAAVGAAPLLVVDMGPAEEAVELVAAADDVLETAAWTSVGLRVPHVLQESEPGFASRHCWKVARQM